MKKIYIYTLSDPSNMEVRYIGKTGNIKNRYISHISNSKHLTSYLGNWIKHLLNKGLKPVINIIEECDESNWIEREIYHIKSFKDAGFDLINYSKGGNEPPNKIDKNLKKFRKIVNKNGIIKYEVRRSFNNEVYSLGTFDNEQDAIKTFDEFKSNLDKHIKPKRKFKQKISVYRNDIFIDTFDSIVECARELNADVSNISKCCNDKLKTHKGYTFTYTP
jgi:hypothetical protein